MLRVTLIPLLLAVSLGVSVSGSLAAQTLAPQGDLKPCPEPPRTPFRYVITRDEVTESTYYPQGGKFRTRGVNVLLDEKSFSESTLKQLFALISKRFPDPDGLRVTVYTNLEDMMTPEEGEHISFNCTLQLELPKFPLGVLHEGRRARAVRLSEQEGWRHR